MRKMDISACSVASEACTQAEACTQGSNTVACARTLCNLDPGLGLVLNFVDVLASLANHSAHVVVGDEVLLHKLALHVDAARHERPDPLRYICRLFCSNTML